MLYVASVAQWIRHCPPKAGIAGSSPAGGWIVLAHAVSIVQLGNYDTASIYDDLWKKKSELDSIFTRIFDYPSQNFIEFKSEFDTSTLFQWYFGEDSQISSSKYYWFLIYSQKLIIRKWIILDNTYSLTKKIESDIRPRELKQSVLLFDNIKIKMARKPGRI